MLSSKRSNIFRSFLIIFPEVRSSKWSKLIIDSDMLSIHSSVCALMYLRNAKLFHRPSSMILVGCLLVRKRAMAAPEWINLFPTSFALNPNASCSPPILQHHRIIFSVNSLVISPVFTSQDAVAQMKVSPFASGTNQRILRMILPKQRTGQRDPMSVRRCVLFSNFSPFFWSSKVIVM